MISAGQDILASDFVSTSAGAGDSGKVAKLDATGKIDKSFINTKFGGTGADGALSISSGTTNINVGAVRVYELNYTSLSITGTGALTFSNPHINGTFIIIRVQGDVTLTSSAAPMLDASGMGAVGGAQIVAGASVNQNGNAGNTALGFTFQTTGGNAATTVAVGSASAIGSPVTTYETITSLTAYKYSRACPGPGGSTGSVNTSVGGSATAQAGGNGGGALIIECAGAWNFTTANGISVAGKSPTDAAASGGNSSAGGSAGGSGGFLLAMYNSLTANSGTVDVGGGIGSKGATTIGSTFYGGGAPGSLTQAGTAGTSSGVTGTKTGADGRSGYSLVTSNTDFF